MSLATLLLALPTIARAQEKPQSTPPAGSQTTPPPQTPAPMVFTVTVIGTTPLAGVDLPLDEIPAPVQVATEQAIQQSGALDLSDFMNRGLNGVHVNEVQGNPFQPDINYRGYTASPLLGTPQGLSVYMDGVRLNQPFGEVVSWDVIPRIAISSVALMPGSNPMFGLNTLGGALSIQTKDGRISRGTTVQAIYGNDARRAIEFEHGGGQAAGLSWYFAGNLFDEDGWRNDSPSTVRQLFGKLGWDNARTDLKLTSAYTNASLTGNGLQDLRFLDRDYASVYTKPDTTDNRSTFFNVAARRTVSSRATFAGNIYYRDIRTSTLNGDLNEDSLDEPVTTYNGLVNRTRTVQHNAGGSGQLTLRDNDAGRNQFTAGAAYDHSTVGFMQSTEFGHLDSERSVTGVGVFGDGVDLDGTIHTWSLYATDTLSVGGAWHVTLSGRYNTTAIHNRDRIKAGGGPGSLDGDHVFSRFNPAAGVTFSPSRAVNLYAGYGEGSRAATSIELGCANAEEPCKLPNAMAGDPPLKQVVTRTWESGVRGHRGSVNWSASVFRAENRDDILFVMSGQTGFGYFKNFGQTRRQGFELNANSRLGPITIGAGYTLLDATYQSPETVNGRGNSRNDAAAAGFPGIDGSIEIEPGDRISLIPRHMLKAFAEIRITSEVSMDLDVVATSSSFARGNENNAHQPDGVYYLGPGVAAGYAVLNVGASYRVRSWLHLLLQVNNLLDRHYYTAAQLGPGAFTDAGAFVAHPFPAVDGAFPARQTTFYAPGSPRRAWVGTRMRF